MALTGASTATPQFTAPDPGTGSVPLIFRLTVTDNQGAPGTDDVRVDAWNSESLRFSDSFATNTLGSYALTLIEPTKGTATFTHDAIGQRARINAGNDFGLRVAHAVPPRTGGRLSLDLLPTQKWPNGGRIFLRLIQDPLNYYEVSNFDGGAPGGLRKVVNGIVVASAPFASGYVQNAAYHVALDFAPALTDFAPGDAQRRAGGEPCSRSTHSGRHPSHSSPICSWRRATASERRTMISQHSLRSPSRPSHRFAPGDPQQRAGGELSPRGTHSGRHLRAPHRFAQRRAGGELSPRGTRSGRRPSPPFAARRTDLLLT